MSSFTAGLSCDDQPIDMDSEWHTIITSIGSSLMNTTEMPLVKAMDCE